MLTPTLSAPPADGIAFSEPPDETASAELVVAPGDHLGPDRQAEEEKLMAWLVGGTVTHL